MREGERGGEHDFDIHIVIYTVKRMERNASVHYRPSFFFTIYNKLARTNLHDTSSDTIYRRRIYIEPSAISLRPSLSKHFYARIPFYDSCIDVLSIRVMSMSRVIYFSKRTPFKSL